MRTRFYYSSPNISIEHVRAAVKEARDRVIRTMTARKRHSNGRGGRKNGERADLFKERQQGG